MAAAGLGLGLSNGLSGGRWEELPRLLGGSLLYLPAIRLLTAIAVILIGWLPRALGLVWAALAVCFVMGYLGQLLSFPSWLLGLSPFTHTPQIPVTGFALTPPLVMLRSAGLVGAVGPLGLLHRDIA